MALAAKAALEAIDAIADRGYFNGADCSPAMERGSPRPCPTGASEQEGMFVKADFAYDAGTDV